MTRAVIRVLLGSALVCLTAAVTSAQTGTTTQTKKFEVISVDGNRLVVKLPEGTKELTVPEDFRFNVDGKMMSVHELKPGMAGTATITTRTTQVPVTVTEIKQGTVMQVSGSTMIVRTDEGIKMFTEGDVDKRGVKIMKDGMPAQFSDFHTNDKLTATIITSKPPRIMTEQQVQATLARSAGGGTSAGSAPAASAAAPRKSTATSGQSTATSGQSMASSRQTTAASGQTAAGGAPKKLPKTASQLPLLGLMGLASLFAGLGLTAWRRRAAH